MILDLPKELESAAKEQANGRGVTPTNYVREVLQRDLASTAKSEESNAPFESGRGMLAKYGPAPSAKEIDENRADMFRGFGEGFE